MTARAVIWDLDGTLIDSKEAHYESWFVTMEKYGFPCTREQLDKAFGRANDATTEFLLGENYTPELGRHIPDEKEAYYRDHSAHLIRLLPGAWDWLEQLAAAGWQQGIGSSAPQANLDQIVDLLKLRPFMGALCSSPGLGLPSKPEPDIFLRTAHELGVDPANCIVVEDVPAGIKAAKRAGMGCIAVATTYPTKVELAEADVIVDRLNMLSPTAFEDLVGQ